jgi:hypothetical protein
VPKIADGRAPRDRALVCRQLAPHSHKADTTDFTTKATTNNSLNHTQGQTILRGMVLDSVTSVHSKRNYAKALDDLFAFAASRPLTRALLMEYRATMDALSPSTVNVRLSAVRKMVTEARKNGMIGAEEAANLTDVPNIPQKGTRLGNWLTREQAKELLAVPRSVDAQGQAGLRYPGDPGRLRPAPAGAGRARCRDHPVAGGENGCWPISKEKGAGSAPSPSRYG